MDQTQTELQRLLTLKKEWLENEAMRFYEPHPRQLEFHQSQAQIRAILAGNRWGKTWAAAMDLLWTIAKIHPYRPNKVGPLAGRDCCVNFNTILTVLIPTYKRIVPRTEAKLTGLTFEGRPRIWPGLKGGSWDRAWSSTDKSLHLADNSHVEFKSYEQGRDAFQGTTLECIREDEEPPQDVHNENMARFLTTGINLTMSMTPINYSQWVATEIFEGSARYQHIALFKGATSENPYVDPDALAQMAEMWTDPAERSARLFGEPTWLQGRVWKEYGDHNLVDFFSPPSHWKRTILIDPHEVKPTAVNWFARDDNGTDWAYREADLSGDVEQICKEIIAQSANEKINAIFMDPSARREATIRGKGRMIDDFRQHLGAIIEANNSLSHGIDLVRQVVRFRPGRQRFHVMRSCPVTDYQMRAYSWKPPLPSGEARAKPEVVKKNEDHCDNVRYYFASSVPILDDEPFEGFGIRVYAN